jgi:hypothetical protein
MTARLVAILFDEKTQSFLERFEPVRDDDDPVGIPAMHEVGDLSHLVVALDGLEDGHYTLILTADFAKGPTGHLTLVRAGNEANPVLKKTVDLQPLIDSEMADHDEYNQLALNAADDEEDGLVDEDLSSAIMDAINRKRAADVEGFLAPYLTDNIEFNAELLDALDYMVYPLMKNGVKGIERELIEPEPPSQKKNTKPVGRHLH